MPGRGESLAQWGLEGGEGSRSQQGGGRGALGVQGEGGELKLGCRYPGGSAGEREAGRETRASSRQLKQCAPGQGGDWALWVGGTQGTCVGEQVDRIVPGQGIRGEQSRSDRAGGCRGPWPAWVFIWPWGLTWMALGCWRDSVYLPLDTSGHLAWASALSVALSGPSPHPPR